MWPFNGKKQREAELVKVKTEMAEIEDKLKNQAEVSILNSDILSTAQNT